MTGVAGRSTRAARAARKADARAAKTIISDSSSLVERNDADSHHRAASSSAATATRSGRPKSRQERRGTAAPTGLADSSAQTRKAKPMPTPNRRAQSNFTGSDHGRRARQRPTANMKTPVPSDTA